MNNLFLKGNTVLHGPEIDLSENERYYRTLIHSLHEDLLVIDRDFRITDINNMALKTLAKTRQEILDVALRWDCDWAKGPFTMQLKQKKTSKERLSWLNAGGISL
jgi:PAS domain-containing protein